MPRRTRTVAGRRGLDGDRSAAGRGVLVGAFTVGGCGAAVVVAVEQAVFVVVRAVAAVTADGAFTPGSRDLDAPVPARSDDKQGGRGEQNRKASRVHESSKKVSQTRTSQTQTPARPCAYQHPVSTSQRPSTCRS